MKNWQDTEVCVGSGKLVKKEWGLFIQLSEPQIPYLWWWGCLSASWYREGTFHMRGLSPGFQGDKEDGQGVLLLPAVSSVNLTQSNPYGAFA